MHFAIKMLYTSYMFAVIRHTYVLDVKDKYNSIGEWKHYVWLFADEVDAMAYAITLLDNPLLTANEHSKAQAIETLQDCKFYQVGRDSVAVAEVLETPEIIYEDDNERRENDLH
jgi:hypothetical protein|tara:strand:- start:2944 stop:3285 length:342 start_codon:yes stop_codon:yes gene_type:complete